MAAPLEFALAANEAVAEIPVDGFGTVTIALETTGDWNGTLTFQLTNTLTPGTTDWINRNANNANGGSPVQTYTTAATYALFETAVAGYQRFRVYCTPYVAGTATVTLNTSPYASALRLTEPIPAGQALIGQVGAIGDAGHDVSDGSTGPVKVGHRAIDLGTNPTAVGAADRTNWYALRNGIPFTLGGHMNTQSLRATYTTAQTDTAIVSVSAGTRIVVLAVLATLSADTTPNVSVLIGFHATTTPTTTAVVAAHPGIEPGGGFAWGDGGGILGIGGDGDDLRITSAVPTDGRLDIVVIYFTVATG